MIIHSYNSTYRLKYYHVIIHNYARKLNFSSHKNCKPSHDQCYFCSCGNLEFIFYDLVVSLFSSYLSDEGLITIKFLVILRIKNYYNYLNEKTVSNQNI